MTETLELLGKLVVGEAERDAVHIAVVPMVAGDDLEPGDRVAIYNGEAVGAVSSHVGVVDPYLDEGPRRGERFWLFLNPGSITSLRHDWTHPAFEEMTEEKIKSKVQHESDSEEWIRRHAEHLGLSRAELLYAAERWIHYEHYTVQSRSERWRDEFGPPREFWHHYEIVTGTKVEDHEATFFCCSC